VRAPGFALALVPAAALLAACGGGSVSPDSVAKAATKTSTTKSYRIEATTKLKVQGREVTFKADGAFDPKRRIGRTNLDMSQLNQVQGGQGSPYNLGYATFILSGTAVYMRIPLLRQTYPTLKPWVKIDLRRAARSGGLDSFLQFGGGGDPASSLAYLKAVGKLHKEGSEQVRGVSTTHYRGTIDVAKLKGGATLRRLTSQSTIPVDVWVDADGYVRREQWKEQVDFGNAKSNLALRLELFDFGTPVSVQAPPASDVTDLSKLGAGT
jgi:LppX_LprAFG lipoprotein